MTNIGTTGHQNIPPEAKQYVTTNVRTAVRSCPPPRVLFSSLAAGADQLVAQIVLEQGGSLHAILPSAGYDQTLHGRDRATYETLLGEASATDRLDFQQPSEEAYWAAGKAIVDRCEVLIAIWDGLPSRGLGGTADAVSYAHDQGKDVRVIWPAGVSRS